MNAEDIRTYCLAKPGTEEGLPFGEDTLVFKVQGKIFLLLSLDTHPLQFNVKCDPDKAIELRDEHSSIIPGYHMNKRHWNTVIDDGSITNKLIREMIDHSYSLVFKQPKQKTRK